MMSIEDRIRAIAMRRRPIKAPCALRKLNEQQQQDFYYRRLKYEYEALPDDKKQQWLDEQETT